MPRRPAAAPARVGATATPAGGRRKIDYQRLDDVLVAARNPKLHADAAIRSSIERFGYVEPIVIDERTGRLVAGHGRLAQLRELRSKAGKTGRGRGGPPDGVSVDADGAWYVPVVRGWKSADDAEAEAYLNASNRLVELGGWDAAVLVESLTALEQIDPELVRIAGFVEADLAAAVADLERLANSAPPAGGGSAHDAPPLGPPISAPGELYELGPHRLLCGDATDPAVLARVMAGDRAACLWTDPPYGVDYTGKTRRALKLAGDREPDAAIALFADMLEAIRQAKPLIPGAAFYVAHPDGPLSADFRALLLEAPFRYRQTLVWAKDALVLGHSDHHYRHEPVAFGTVGSEEELVELHLAAGIPDLTPAVDLLVAAGADPAIVDELARARIVLQGLLGYPLRHAAIGYGVLAGGGKRGRGAGGWQGSNGETTLFEVPRPKASLLHPTMKPIDLVARQLGNSTRRGQLVLDPFAGSGTTLLAAAVLGRHARVVELDPAYVDVICRRWTHVTGQPAILDGKARKFPPLEPDERAG